MALNWLNYKEIFEIYDFIIDIYQITFLYIFTNQF